MYAHLIFVWVCECVYWLSILEPFKPSSNYTKKKHPKRLSVRVRRIGCTEARNYFSVTIFIGTHPVR